jgi:hypothetical protein
VWYPIYLISHSLIRRAISRRLLHIRRRIVGLSVNHRRHRALRYSLSVRVCPKVGRGCSGLLLRKARLERESCSGSSRLSWQLPERGSLLGSILRHVLVPVWGLRLSNLCRILSRIAVGSRVLVRLRRSGLSGHRSWLGLEAGRGPRSIVLLLRHRRGSLRGSILILWCMVSIGNA